MKDNPQCTCSVTKSCLILCDPMDCSLPGFHSALFHAVVNHCHFSIFWEIRLPLFTDHPSKSILFLKCVLFLSLLELPIFNYYYYIPLLFRASLIAQSVKNLPAMQETQVQSLGREDPLEKGMATHSSILAWRIPWTEEPGRLPSMGSQRVGHNLATKPPPYVYVANFF